MEFIILAISIAVFIAVLFRGIYLLGYWRGNADGTRWSRELITGVHRRLKEKVQ